MITCKANKQVSGEKSLWYKQVIIYHANIKYTNTKATPKHVHSNICMFAICKTWSHSFSDWREAIAESWNPSSYSVNSSQKNKGKKESCSTAHKTVNQIKVEHISLIAKFRIFLYKVYFGIAIYFLLNHLSTFSRKKTI